MKANGGIFGEIERLHEIYRKTQAKGYSYVSE